MLSKQIGKDFIISIKERHNYSRLIIKNNQWYHIHISGKMPYENALAIYEKIKTDYEIMMLIIPYRMHRPNRGILKKRG